MDFSRRSRRGIASVYFAIAGLALAGLFALTLETAHYYYAFHQLQAAADASALAAMDYIETDQGLARTHAADVAADNIATGDKVIVQTNGSNDPAGDIVFGNFNLQTRVLTPTTNNPKAARVAANRTDTAHGGMVKFLFSYWNTQSGSSQSATATAMLYLPQPGLLMLNADNTNTLDQLSLKGGNQARITVTGGSIIVNSQNSEGANIQGDVVADSFAFAGGITYKNTLMPPLISMTKQVADPMAGVPPIAPADYGLYGGNQTGTTDPLEPGVHLTGLPNGNYRLKPGVYILGGNWAPGTYTSRDPVTGQLAGVTLYLLPTTDPKATLGPGLTIRAPDPSLGDNFYGANIYAHIAIYQERTPGSFVTIPKYNGSPNFNVTGAVYLPYTNIKATGDFGSLGNELILNGLDLQGSTSMTINSQGLFPVTGTPQRILVK